MTPWWKEPPLSEWTYIALAYGLTWAAIAIYALGIARRRRRITADLQQEKER